MERIEIYNKRNSYFIGCDMHKDIHCAVIIDSWMKKIGEIVFENRPSKFPAFVDDVRKICGNKNLIFGLEDTRGFGRNLACYLVGRKFVVKQVNPSYTSAVRLANPIVYKDDSYDAYCVSRVLRDMVDKLPDAKHEDIFWTIRQIVKRRDLIIKSNVMNKSQLHSQLMYVYPSYRKFFSEIDGKMALCFWENYPSPDHALNSSPADIYKKLKEVNRGLKFERVEEIVDMIELDGDTRKDYQEERDFIVKNIVKEINHCIGLINEIDLQLEKLIPLTGYKLDTLSGISLVTSAHLISEIGDINRFPDSDKLAMFSGVSPVRFSSANKGKSYRCRNGNRVLNGIFHFLAIQMVQISPSGKARHPIFREYFEKKLKEGKNKPQALVCVSRRIVRIIYGMMKNKTEYIEYQKKEED